MPQGRGGIRLTVIAVVCACLLAALVTRLWDLQVINAPAAQTAAAQNGLVTIYTPAPRGEILDRNGQVLATNQEVPVIEAERQDATNQQVVDRLAPLLGMTDAELESAINNNQYTSLAPVPVYPKPSAAQILYIQEHQSLFPGVTATTELVRYVTALGQYAADVIGYVGEVTRPELAEYQKKYPSEHYEAGEIVGQTGIEEELQQYLAGTPGVEEIQVNASGQDMGVVKSVPPVPGDNVVLTIDADVQETSAKAILQGQSAARGIVSDTGTGYYRSPGGSVVAEDPNNGQILALASEPTFNPNEFDQGITEAEYEAYANNPDDPLENRAIQGQYAPGSTFKLVTATAGLHYGIITPTTYYDDTGEIDLNGYIFHDDDGVGAGEIQLPTALTVSSDNYFNNIGIQLWDGESTYGPDALQDVAGSYGFNQPTGIDLPYENSGLIPSPTYEEKLHQADPAEPGYWVTGDSAEMAIGQFQVEVTPLQLVNAYSTFANGGTRYEPQVVLDIQSPSGKVIKTFSPIVEGHSTPLTADQRQAMIQGYLGVTNDPSGTAYPVYGNSNLTDEDFAGKTGTATVTGGFDQETSVFVGFAPASGPQYVVDSFMEDSGYGVSIAAPVVREVFDQIFNKRLTPIAFQAAVGNAT